MFSTYADGFDILVKKNITTKDISKLCKKLSEEFNKKFNSNDYKFEPEPIGEGGILMTNFPNKTERMFKTMRIKLGYGDNKDRWPWIKDNMIEIWESSEEQNIITSNSKIRTLLKAFHGAPIWTIDELKIFEDCFNEIGVQRKSKYPTKKSLKGKYI